MQTSDFLRAVLPSTGNYFLAIPTKSGGYIHKAYSDIDELAEGALRVSSKGINAFFALANYAQPEYVGDDGKKHWRTGDNAVSTRSQWIDLDGDQRQNLKDLALFCTTTGIPRPNIIVNSGNGIHTYWIFDRDVPRDAWRRSAKVFKAIAAHLNLGQIDTSRTSDVTSILRPIGVINDKTHKGLGIKTVKLLGAPNLEPVNYGDWVRKLVELKAEYGLSVSKSTHANSKDNINSDLGGNIEYPLSSAVMIAEHCAQIASLRDLQGAGQNEPTWRNCVGLLKHCIEGEELIHEWSSGYDGYNAGECSTKIAGWKTGPTTCDSFKNTNAAGCTGCPHTCKSPIQLGRVAPEHETELSTFDKVSQAEVIEQLPDLPPEMLKRYRFRDGYLMAKTMNDDGVTEWLPFCSNLLIPTGYFMDRNDKHTWKMRVDCRMRPGVWKMCELAAKAVGAGGSTLMGELAAKAFVVPSFGRAKLLEEYMKTWAEQLKHDAAETTMHIHMGWQEDDALVIGDRKYLADGAVKQVVLDEQLRNQIGDFEIKGNVARYSELINTLYNRPNHQAYQFTWLSGFASPLLNLLSADPLGLIFSAHGEGGLGKTTAAKLAAGVFHKTSKTVSSFTEYALYVSAGQRKNLLLVLDEVSNQEPKMLSDFAYIYSTGTAKVQGAASGGLRDTSHMNWNNITLLTTNNRLWELVQSHRSECIPQLMRIFEYTFEVTHDDSAESEEGFKIITELMGMHGVAGDVYSRYLVQNRESVRIMVNEAYHKLMKAADLKKDARFWCYGAATEWVAFQITKGLGLHNFDSAAFVKWVVSQLRRLTTLVHDAQHDMALVFGDFMNEVQGGIIVTMNEGHGNGVHATYATGYHPPKGEVLGRAIVELGVVYVKYSALRDWCTKNGFSVSKMKSSLKELGWLRPVVKYSLGRGTLSATPQTRVIQLDWAAFAGKLRVVDTTVIEVQAVAV